MNEPLRGVGEGTESGPGSDVEAAWRSALVELRGERIQLVRRDPSDAGRRVYRLDDRILKIVLPGLVTPSIRRANSLAEEASILHCLVGVRGAPSYVEYAERENLQLLSYTYCEGEPWNDRSMGIFSWFRHMTSLCRLLWLVSMHRVAHNDVKAQNLLVSRERALTLLDFDQANATTRWRATLANFLGINPVRNSYGSLLGMVKERIRGYAPTLVGRLARSEPANWIRRRRHRVPRPGRNATPRRIALGQAWELARYSAANAPGQYLCYYSLDVDGVRLPGERPWEPRWESLSRCTEFNGKRVLELGCNLSLLSCQLLAESGVSAACCVDADGDILAAAQKVAEAFGVSPWYKRVDFDDPEPWEEDLAAFRPNLVIALSVLNWVRDKERFLRFLGRFEEVMFEGHESAEIEGQRLRGVGFSTIVRAAVSERGRPVLVASKL